MFMKQQSSFPTLISLFQTVEEHLHNRKLELALSAVRSILHVTGITSMHLQLSAV